MQLEPLLDSICLRVPLSRPDAQATAAATAAALLRQLPARLSGELCHELPREITRSPQASDPATHADALSAIYADVATASGLEPARAVERVQVVCAALAALLPPELCDRLRRELPTEAQLLLTSREAGEAPLRVGGGNTLADGRPGSRVPVSEGHPGSRHPLSTGQAKRQQQDGVDAGNPHRDTKLSSASGLTQERERESLAEGRSKRP